MRGTALRLLSILVALVACAGAMVAFRPAEPLIDSPQMRLKSPGDLQATISALEDAWETRRTQKDSAGERAERAFLNRVGYVVRASRGTSAYMPARRLWNLCCHDHVRRFPDLPERETN